MHVAHSDRLRIEMKYNYVGNRVRGSVSLTLPTNELSNHAELSVKMGGGISIDPRSLQFFFSLSLFPSLSLSLSLCVCVSLSNCVRAICSQPTGRSARRRATAAVAASSPSPPRTERGLRRHHHPAPAPSRPSVRNGFPSRKAGPTPTPPVGPRRRPARWGGRERM